MSLLQVEHYQQHNETACLAACAYMVIKYFGLPFPFSQSKLHQQFDPTPLGVPFSRLMRLVKYGINFSLATGELSTIIKNIDNGRPLIIFVRTGELSYWQTDTQHAVVIVGYDGRDILLNDPAFEDGPQRASIDEVMLAWDEMDNFYATLSQGTWLQ